VPLHLIGEGLLLLCLLAAPWSYGSVEDSARYSLCAVLLIATLFYGWPELNGGLAPRGLIAAMAAMAFSFAQLGLGQSVAPLVTL
jgi:hypothetical protein